MTSKQSREKSWAFRPADKIAGLSRLTLEEHTVFQPDGVTFRFRGYKTPPETKATVWRKRIAFSLAIASPEMSAASPAVPQTPPKRTRSAPLSPAQKHYIKTLQTRLKALKARLPPPADDALERRYWDYIDPHSFIGAFRKAATIWNNPVIDLPAKCRQVNASLIELHDLLQAMQLPGELMRDDTQFTVVLAKILQLVRIVEEKAEKNGIGLPREVHELAHLLDDLTDRMIEGGNRLYGIEPDMTREERETQEHLERSAVLPGKPLEERLTILETLWENPRIDLDEKIRYLEKAIELIREAGAKKPVKVPCPHEEGIKRHLSAIGRHLREMEEDGLKIWQHRIAEGLADSANLWRKNAGLPPVSPEKWAGKIRLQSLDIQTEDNENGNIRFTATLGFQDRDGVFDGRLMYAVVENGAVKKPIRPE